MRCPSCGAPVAGAGACGSCSAWLPPPRDPSRGSADEAAASVLVTTGPSLAPTHEIAEWCGPVFGESLLSGTTLGELHHGFAGIGAGAAALEQQLQEGRDRVIAQLRERCVAAGGNAVVAVQVGYDDIGRASLLISAQGTAVVASLCPGLEREPVGQGRSW